MPLLVLYVRHETGGCIGDRAVALSQALGKTNVPWRSGKKRWVSNLLDGIATHRPRNEGCQKVAARSASDSAR